MPCTCVRDEHVDDISLHTYIQTYISTGDILVCMIYVGLASTYPNYNVQGEVMVRVIILVTQKLPDLKITVSGPCRPKITKGNNSFASKLL